MKALLLFVVLCTAALAADVTIEERTLKDAKRNREVPIRVYFEVGAGALPVIVFSHGAGGAAKTYDYLGRHWAEHGYVSIHPTHLGSDKSILERGRPLKNAKRLQAAVKDPANLRNRPKDVSFVIDSLGEIEKLIPALKGRLDAGRLGVGGHSFGAFTATVIAGARIAPEGGPLESFADPRAKAIIAMSPQGSGHTAFTPESWATVDRPYLAMTGPDDHVIQLDKDPSWRLEGYRRMPAGDKYSVSIPGATHFTFAAFGRVKGEEYLKPIRELALVFWDAYLKGDDAAKARLKSGEAAKPYPRIKIESK